MNTLKKIGLIAVDILVMANVIYLFENDHTLWAVLLVAIFGMKQYIEGINAGMKIQKNVG